MYKTSENRNPLKTGLLVKSGQGPVFRVFTVKDGLGCGNISQVSDFNILSGFLIKCIIISLYMHNSML
jgi:hypothetical protein